MLQLRGGLSDRRARVVVPGTAAQRSGVHGLRTLPRILPEGRDTDLPERRGCPPARVDGRRFLLLFFINTSSSNKLTAMDISCRMKGLFRGCPGSSYREESAAVRDELSRVGV